MDQEMMEGRDGDRGMELGDLTCLDFFGAAKELPAIFEKKEYWVLSEWLAENALGLDTGDAAEAVRDMPAALMHQTPALEEALSGYAAARESLPDCREQWKRMGVDFDAEHADLCRTCPFSDDCGGGSEREYAALSAILRLSEKKAAPLLNGRLRLSSVENMDGANLFCHVLERPFAYPLARLVYEVLCDDPQARLAEARQLIEGNGANFEKSELYGEVSRRLAEVMKRLGIMIREDLFHRGLCAFLRNAVLLAEPCDEEALELLSGDLWEDDETEDGGGTQDELEQEAPEESAGSGEVEGEAEEAPAEERLEDFPYFTRKGRRTAGAWFGKGEKTPSLSVGRRRYLVPFERAGDEENLIEHFGLSEETCEKLFDASPGSAVPEEARRKELDFLCDKVRADGCAAAEVAWVAGREEYILLVWNAASRRIDFVTLIRKSEGRLLPIPYQITQFLKSEKRRIICYQPYLLCGILGLYGREVELKTLRSVFTRYRVLHAPGGRAGSRRSEVIGTYEAVLDARERFQLSVMRERYGEDSFLAAMPFYGSICAAQERYGAATGMTGILASQSAKDLMYGHSYLRAALFPARQETAFSLCENGHLSFRPFLLGLCYAPGYVMEYRFVRDEEEGDGASEAALRDNRRARQALLKELSKMRAAFYHGDLKVLYADDFTVTFYALKKCRSVHATDVSQILMHETYRYGITSNKVLASFYGVSMGEVRRIERH